LGRINTFDSNHDDYLELSLYVNDNSYYVPNYEYRPINQYIFADTFYQGNGCLPWDVGYLNLNMYTDLIVNGPNIDTINIYESADLYSYPKIFINKFKTDVSYGTIARYYNTDLDRDGLREIMCYSQSNDTLSVYENTTGNNFSLVYNFMVVPYQSALAFAIGDADNDSITEFMTGGVSGRILVFKCKGDNNYQIVWMDTTRISRAAYDPVFVPDMDGDSLPEFIMGCHHTPGDGTWTAVWKFYEADTTVLDSFRVIYIDSIEGITTFPDYESASSYGDIDNCGKPEAVLAVSNNWFIYKSLNNDNFQQIFKAYTSNNGRPNTMLYVKDINNNGYTEIIESGEINTSTSETKIWEIMGEITWDSLTAVNKDSCIEVKWSTAKQFANYGFNVYRSTAVGGPYNIIHETNDTIRLDTASLFYAFNDSAVTTGTKYYYKVQAKLLNDSTQYIGPDSATGVEGRPGDYLIYAFKLGNCYPNPVKGQATIQFSLPQAGKASLKVYNIQGQLVKTLLEEELPAGTHNISWNAKDNNGKQASNGVYFYRLVAGDAQAIKKMIILK